MILSNISERGRVNKLVPTFRSSCCASAPTFHELRKGMGTSKFINSSAAFPFEVPGQNLPLVVQELQMGGTSEFCFVSRRGSDSRARDASENPLRNSIIQRRPLGVRLRLAD